MHKPQSKNRQYPSAPSSDC